MTVTPGVYRHYKGGEYQVIGIARHSETHEEMVVYRALYRSAEFGDHALWVRPLNNFIETVAVGGQQVARFVRIGDTVA